MIPPTVDGYTWELHSWKVSKASGVLLMMWAGTPIPLSEADECQCRGCKTGTGCVAFHGGWIPKGPPDFVCERPGTTDEVTPAETQAFVDTFRLDRDTDDEGD